MTNMDKKTEHLNIARKSGRREILDFKPGIKLNNHEYGHKKAKQIAINKLRLKK